MTWKTPHGARVFTPQERRLFAHGVVSMIDINRDNATVGEEEMELIRQGVGPFDNYSVKEKCKVLLEVCVCS